MLRAAIVGTWLLLFVGCGSDPDPHALTTCDGWVDNQGNPITGQCEAACESPPVSTGETCDTTAQLGCREFEFGSLRGCCVPDTASSVIRFHECASG